MGNGSSRMWRLWKLTIYRVNETAMSPVQKQLVQKSLRLIVPKAEPIAALLYKRLFAIDPTLQALFHTEMDVLGGKLIATLILVARTLDEPERFLPALWSLGQRHVNYGVQPEDYQPVGQALEWALRQELGQLFTAELTEAWLAFYDFLADIMQEAAREMAPCCGLSYLPK